MSISSASRGVAAVAAFVAATLTSACSAPREVAAEPPPLRVMVKLVRGSEDRGAISAEASRIAGVRVSYAAATSVQWHALALHCTSDAECDAAIERLRAAGNVYQTVEIEGRKTRAST